MALDDSLHSLLGRYMLAPQWVRTGTGTLYRALPPSFKYGPLYAGFLNDSCRDDETVSLEEVEKRLAATLNAALRNVPAFIPFKHLADDTRSAFERLRDIPPTSKSEIKSDISAYLSTTVCARERLPMFTGGSTTHPMRFFLEKSSSRTRESAYSATIDAKLLRARVGDWTLSLRGRTVPSATSGKLWMTEPIKRHLILSSDHLEERYMARYVDVLRRMRPRLVHAYPSALYPLTRWLAENPCPEFTDNVAGILLTSENVYDFQNALFEAVFNCPVIRHYGHSERVVLAHSFPEARRYHFRPLYGFAELVDPVGRAIDIAGQAGEIVGTSFNNSVMPFVRYRTGDIGVWATAPRTNGSSAAVMLRIDGRLQEFVVCRDHRLVSITTLGAAHFSELAGVEAIQFEQDEPGLVILRIVTSRVLQASEREAIRRAIREKTQGGCDVKITPTDRLQRTGRGKLAMLIQKLDLAEYFAASRPEPDNVQVEHQSGAERPQT